MIDQNIIEKIVTEILFRLEAADRRKKPELLVILPQTKNCDKQIAVLNQYWHVHVIHDVNGIIPNGVQQAVFLEVDQDLLVKAALGIIDSSESLLFSKLLLQDCKVAFIPDSVLSAVLNPKESRQGNKTYVKKLIHYKTELESYGVYFDRVEAITPKNVLGLSDSTINKETKIKQKNLITKEMIEGWKEDWLYMDPNTIITPLALDIAKEKGIKIFMNEAERGVD